MLDILFLHIGTHKTGSTSIQSFLEKNSEKLLELHDIKVAIKGMIKLKFDIDNKIGKCQIKQIDLKSLSSSKNKKAIISRENFFWLHDINEILKLSKLLYQYAKVVKIICYIRRQDQLAISHKQTGTRFKHASDAYGHEPYALPKNISNLIKSYMNYNSRINLWADVFGEKNIIIHPFEKEQLVQNDVVLDFLNILGLNKNYFTFGPRRYESLTRENQLFLHQIFPIFSKNISLYKKIIKIIIKSDKSKTIRKKLLPSKYDAVKFYNSFKKTNEILNKRFKINSAKYIFNNDFSMYPTSKDDEGLSKEEISKIFFSILNEMEKNN